MSKKTMMTDEVWIFLRIAMGLGIAGGVGSAVTWLLNRKKRSLELEDAQVKTHLLLLPPLREEIARLKELVEECNRDRQVLHAEIQELRRKYNELAAEHVELRRDRHELRNQLMALQRAQQDASN